MRLMDRAREVAARTPPHRNRYVDFLRAVSICVVVLGHWLIAVFTVEDDRIVAGHLLAEAPWTQALTWIFQVMPVFFIVGGFSNAASWSAALKSGKSYGNWLRSRCQRLLGPTAGCCTTARPRDGGGSSERRSYRCVLVGDRHGQAVPPQAPTQLRG